MAKTRRTDAAPKLPKTPPPTAANKAAAPAPAAISRPVPPAATDKMETAATLAIDAARPSAPTSQIEFNVHPGLGEVQSFAASQGWLASGYTHLSIFSQELVYTTDNWKTTQVLKSFDVPSPFVNGRILLPNVPAGTPVEFALHVGVACHAPSDIAGYRERGDVWLNNGGQNYRQVTR